MEKLSKRIKDKLRGRSPLFNVDRGAISDIIDVIGEVVEDFIVEVFIERMEENKDGNS